VTFLGVVPIGGKGSGRRPYKHLTRVGVSAPQATKNESPVDDPDGVLGEFNELAAETKADGSLSAYRSLHETARVCRSNGYDVRYNPLPLLIVLAGAMTDASLQRDRNSLRAEIMSVYQDMRDWRA
jgi:hypothetical protein